MNRNMFHQLLSLVAAQGPGSESWRDWVKRSAQAKGLGEPDSDHQLVELLTERLDLAAEDQVGFRTLAKDFASILSSVEPDRDVALLALLAEWRATFSDMLEKHLQRVITRTSFLSYVAARQWPEELKQRLLSLEDTELRTLLVNLRVSDWSAVLAILWPDHEWDSS